MTDKETWLKLLGKQVSVTIQHPKGDKPLVVVEGTLIAFDEGGEARIRQEDGFVCFCWPMLDVEELTPVSQ